MESKIQKYISKTIFVDTNAFIYFLTGKCNRLTIELFKLSLLKKVKLITSTRVLDELLFKVMLIEARRRYNLKSNIPQKLKRDKNKVKELAKSCKLIFDFLKDFRIETVEVKASILKAIPQIMETYGLFGNDAITLKIMKGLNLKYILTADRDFENLNLKDIEIINPL